MYGKTYMGVQRNTYLIDPEGRIERVWEKVKPEDHAAEVLGGVSRPLHRHGADGRKPVPGHQHGLGKTSCASSASSKSPIFEQWA